MREYDRRVYTRVKDYAVYRNSHHCNECGWNRQGGLMKRDEALSASANGRFYSPHDGWMARRVKFDRSSKC